MLEYWNDGLMGSGIMGKSVFGTIPRAIEGAHVK
jgi:hypothetical protein